MSKRRKSNTGQTVKVGQDDTAMDVTEQPDIGPVAAKVASLNQSLQAGLESMKQGGAESTVATLALGILDLKRLVRSGNERLTIANKRTLEEKERVDLLHLTLQNLLYKKFQLQKDIKTCRQFRSRDAGIELISEEAFFDPATGPSAVDQSLREDPHKLRLERLAWELKERQRLAENLKDLKTKKAAIEKEILQASNKLEEMPGKVEKVLEAAKPITKFFGERGTSLVSNDSPAKLLPRPLFILFMHCSAFSETEDPTMSVEIVGDVDAALALPKQEESWGNVDEDDDNAEADMDEGGDSSRRLKSRKSAADIMEERRKLIIQPHPLSVKLTIRSSKLVLQVEFKYLSRLSIVTVFSSMENPITSGDILAHLFPGDAGIKSPNPTNLFQMDNLRMQPFETYLDQIGRPYTWAQAVCGLSGMSSDASAHLQQERMSLVQVLRSIKSRIEMQHSLASQLKSLGEGKITVSAKAQKEIFPLKATAKLTTCVEIPPAADDLACDTRQFTMTFKREDVVLKASVEVTLAYPRDPPSFRVEFTKAPAGRTGVENNLRAIETELNVYWTELTQALPAKLLLTHQVRLLQQCFDMFMESEERQGEQSLGSGKLYVKGVRGKDRLRPYKYDMKTGFFEFR